MADDEDYGEDFHLTDEDDDYGDDNFEDDEDFQKFLDAKDDHFLDTPKRPAGKGGAAQGASGAEQRLQSEDGPPPAPEEPLEPDRISGKDPDRRLPRGEARLRMQRWEALQAAGVRFVEVEADLYELPPQPVSLLFYGNKGPFFNTETRAVGLSLASRDAQTEPVGISESSAQAPEFSLEVAGQAQASLGSSTARRKQAAGAGGRVQLEMSEALQKHLAMFVQGAFPIVDSVLAGRVERQESAVPGAVLPPSGSVADCVVPFHHPIVAGRRAVALALSPPSRSSPWQMVLVAYGPRLDAGQAAPAQSGDGNGNGHGGGGGPWANWSSPANLDRCGLLCTWSLQAQRKRGQEAPEAQQAPLHVCITEGTPSCCCWGPTDRSFVACGEEEGALSLWDLSEAEETHQARAPDALGGLCLRVPTFSTESDPLATGAATRVVRLAPSAGLSQGDDGDCLFSMLSLDERGAVSQWDAVRAGKPLAAGVFSLGEGGLRFGGRVRLELARAGIAYSSAAIAAAAGGGGGGGGGGGFGDGPGSPMSPLSPAARRGGMWGAGAGGELGLEAFDLCLLSGEESSTLFAVATDEGTVRLGTPVGRLPAPSVLTPDAEGRLKSADLGPATSLHPHPLFPDVVVAGFAFGGMCAFHSSSRKPLRRWEDATGGSGAAVLAARWSAVRASLVFVLDSYGTLRLFDVLREGDEPLHEERVIQGDAAADPPTAMEVSAQPISHAASVRRQLVAITFRSGAVSVHVVDSKVDLLGPDDFLRLDAALKSPYKKS